MKYCIDYYKKSKILKQVDELNIDYSLQNTTLLEFLITNKDKRVNIVVEDEHYNELMDIIDKINDIKKSNENLQLFLRLQYYSKEEIEKLKEYNIPFYLDIRANNWDIFNGLVELGVSDIYITEDLGFELEKLAEIAHSKGIQLRAYPNVAQSQWDTTPALKKFFIRPEDVDKYANYIDVLEFFGAVDKSETLYKIYAIDKKWYGKLNEIIIGFNSDLDNRFLVPRFCDFRTNCKKKCVKGHSCGICEAVETLSHTLENQGIIFETKKPKSVMKDEEEFKQELDKMLNKEEK